MNLDWIFAGAQTQQVMPTVRYNKIGIIENEMAKSDISVQDFPTGDKPNYLEENSSTCKIFVLGSPCRNSGFYGLV